jgi:hypothetical protein
MFLDVNSEIFYGIDVNVGMEAKLGILHACWEGEEGY